MTNLVDQYPVRDVSFGVEMEFNFAVKKELQKAFVEAGGDERPEDPAVTIALAAAVAAAAAAAKVKAANPPLAKQGTPPAVAEEEDSDEDMGDDDDDDAGLPGVIKVPVPSDVGSESTRDSDSVESQYSIIRYICDLLNHKLPYSPKTPPLIGHVVYTVKDKIFPPDEWHITYDATVWPHRAEFTLAIFRAAQAKDPSIEVSEEAVEANLQKVKDVWRVGGAELVSAALQFGDDEDWYGKFLLLLWLVQEPGFQNNLNDKAHRTFFLEKDTEDVATGLHVHVAIIGESNLDSPLGLACMKNVVALYGLFEDEIGRWLPKERRDDTGMATRVRHGMELIEWENSERSFYTAQFFTELVYDAENVRALKVAATGSEDSRYCTVNISEARPNKPTTLEFRQHHGTTDPEVIKWWVTFVTALLRYSYFLAQWDLQVRDYGDLMDVNLPADRFSTLERYSLDHSILDVIGFSDEGKAHFAAMARQYRDDYHDAERELDEWFILKRAASSRADGEYTGKDFDKKLRGSPEYNAECARLQTKYGLKIPLEQRNNFL